MKFLVYILLLFFAKVSFAQNEGKKEVFTQIETMPEFPGGPSEMMRFIQKNIQLPESSKEIDNIGKVFLKFVVNADGKVSDVIVLKSSGCELCDKEGIRVISIMPLWKPGTQNGKTVPVFFNLPINFSMKDTWKVVNSRSPNHIFSPIFKGGTEDMLKFIDKNKVYPKALKEKGVIGETIVKFLVDSTGKISHAIVRQSSGYVDLDNEALRVVSIMPNWIPAIEDGKRLNRYCDLPISFGKNSKIIELRKNQYDLSNKYFNDGMKEFQTNNIIAAKENYKKAYELNCYHSDALYNLGVSYFKLNQKDSACVCWNELKTNFAKQEADELIKKFCLN